MQIANSFLINCADGDTVAPYWELCQVELVLGQRWETNPNCLKLNPPERDEEY